MSVPVAAVRVAVRPPGSTCCPSWRYVWPFRIVLHGCLVNAALWGGPVVRAAALCAIPLALLYDLGGGLRHLVHVAGLTLAVWLGANVGDALGAAVTSGLSVPPAVGYAAGLALPGVATLLLAGVAGRRLARTIRRRPHWRGVDHLLGAALGVAEGALLVVVLCWLLAAFRTPLENLRARLPQQTGGLHNWLLDAFSDLDAVVQRDPAGRWLTRRNPLESLPAVQAGQVAMEIASAPEALLAALDAGRLDELAQLPEMRKYVQAVEDDQTLTDAIQRQDVAALLRHPTVKAMLKDRDLHRALLAHRDALRTALAGTEPPTEVVPRTASGTADPGEPQRFRIVDDLGDAWPGPGDRRP